MVKDINEGGIYAGLSGPPAQEGLNRQGVFTTLRKRG